MHHHIYLELVIGRAGLGWAGLKLARIFRTKILAAQLALKIGLIGSNSLLKVKKIRAGWTEPYWVGLNLARFFRANNLMAQPDPNSGWTGQAHRTEPILPPLHLSSNSTQNKLLISTSHVTFGYSHFHKNIKLLQPFYTSTKGGFKHKFRVCLEYENGE